MNGSNPDALPPLGRKVEAPIAAPTEPQWKPMQGHGGYETDGSSVRREADRVPANPWARYMIDLGGYVP